MFKKIAMAIAALGLAVFLIPGVPNCAEALVLSNIEIRDPMMNNAVAARVVLPQGWVLKEQQVLWNMDLYGDPARVVFGLEGPADEVEFAAVSRLKFNFDQSWLAITDQAYNQAISMANEQCQMSQRYTPAYAQQMCAQIFASMQPELQKIQQHKAALLAGQVMENGMIARPPMSAVEVAEWVLQQDKEISDIRVKKSEQPADLVAMLRKAVTEADAQVRQMAAQLNLPFKGLNFDVARTYYSYTKNGKRYDGMSLVVTRYCTLVNNQRMPTFSGQSGPDPLYGKEFTLWDAHINGATARAGKLQAHEAELTAIAANSAVDPVWQAAVDKLSEEISRKVAKAKAEGAMKQLESQLAHQGKMQAMRNDTFNYVSQRRQEVFSRRSESLSKAATGWTDVLTDRQRWQGGGTKYVAPNNYKYAWENSNGNTVFSNDSGFNPNHSSNFSGNWNEMRKVPW